MNMMKWWMKYVRGRSLPVFWPTKLGKVISWLSMTVFMSITGTSFFALWKIGQNAIKTTEQSAQPGPLNGLFFSSVGVACIGAVVYAVITTRKEWTPILMGFVEKFLYSLDRFFQFAGNSAPGSSVRYAITFVSAWLAGYLTFRIYAMILLGPKMTVARDELKVMYLSFAAIELLLAVFYAPVMLAIGKLVRSRHRVLAQILGALILGYAVPTLGAMKFSHFNVLSAYYYAKNWTVYLYFVSISLVFVLGWIWAQPDSSSRT